MTHAPDLASNVVVCLAGPTGTGKSALAIALARYFGGAIVNLDSRQIYSGLPVITAQPSKEEFEAVPHLLYGFLPCSRKMTAGLFAELALEAAGFCFSAGRLPILVGGTGLYLDALINGIAPIPEVGREISSYWRMRLERAGARELYRELVGADPEYAAKISSNDPQRITRALEVWTGTGRTLSWWHSRPLPPFPYRVLKLGLKMPMDRLESRLALRIERMLELGALAEVERGMAVDPGGNLPGFSSIGFLELSAYLSGETSLAESKEKWLRATRAYAKRQLTWFGRDADMHWLSERGSFEEGVELLASFLNRSG